jgi:AbrB family looped-hinge helix DNA binding protein
MNARPQIASRGGRISFGWDGKKLHLNPRPHLEGEGCLNFVLQFFLNSDILNSEKYMEVWRCTVQTARSVTAEIKSRGQLTIPKKIRVMSRLEEGQAVSIIPVGDSVIITPKRLELDEARREMKKILKASGVSLEDLLAGLKEEREKLYQETYGKKSR